MANDSNSTRIEDVYDVIIIGAGPCGLATAARLREKHPSALFTDEEQSRYAWVAKNANRSSIRNYKNGSTRAGPAAATRSSGPSMLVLDSSSDQWMAKWNALFKKFEISHLRSPMFFHPDPSDRDALLAFAHEQGLMDELVEIGGCVGKEVSKHKRKKKTSRRDSGPRAVVEVDERDRKDYFTPSTACFEGFCSACIRRYKLQDHIIQQETVIDIDYDFFPHIRDDVKLFQIRTNHRRYSARTAVMATGGGTPVMPKPFAASLPSAASHAMWLDRDCVLSDDLRSKIRARKNVSVLVVGGGLTSAQIADCLIRKGVDRVHLVMRGSWKVKPFDVDLKWMSKFRNQQRAAFWTADDLEERLAQAKEARNGGSMTPVFSKVLKRHIQAGNLVVHTNTFISSQKYDEESKLWSIGTEPPPATDLPHFDHIYFATGTHLDVNQLAMLQTMQRRFPIDSYGGFPALTDDLMWADDVPLFMTGKLATLQIGPGAANLEGARLSAERIAWGVEKALGESSGRLEGEHVDDNPRDSYVDGIGSKFAQLPEE